jgi:hypothetical protein
MSVNRSIFDTRLTKAAAFWPSETTLGEVRFQPVNQGINRFSRASRG